VEHFGQRSGKHSRETVSALFRAYLARRKHREKSGVSKPFGGSKVKQVKEAGLLKLPRLGSQRTATPTAQGMTALFPRLWDRGCKQKALPAFGVVPSLNAETAGKSTVLQ